MKCKKCGSLLNANTLLRCPNCADEQERQDAKKYAGEFGVINRAFEVALKPLRLDLEYMWLSIPLVLFLGIVVAVFILIYSITVLPVRILLRRILGVY